MTKKVLSVFGIVLLVLMSFSIYRKHKFEQKINQKYENLTDQQRQSAKEDLKQILSNDNQIRDSFIDKFHVPVVPINNQVVENAVIDANIKGADAVIKNIMRTGIPSGAEIYFSNHQNYGISNLDNICTNSDFDSLTPYLLDINMYSKIPAKCFVPAQFPSQTFTVVVPVITGESFYCTDQTNFGNVVENSSESYVTGVRCK